MRRYSYFFTFVFLAISINLSFAQSTVTLKLRSQGTNIKVDSAEVALLQTDIKTMSNKEGIAELSGLDNGFYLLTIKHPDFIDQTLTLNLTSKDRVEKDVILTPSLDEIVVTAERFDKALRDRGFYERKEKGSATFLTPEEIKKRGKLNPIDIFKNISGVQVRKKAYGNHKVISTRRKSSGKILESANPCEMDVFLDGASVGGQIETVINSVDEVVAAEIYKGPSTVPSQYNNFNSCGAILIWTKSGLME